MNVHNFPYQSSNHSLSYLLASRAFSKFDVVVDPSGNGDYTNIANAIASGAEFIYVKSGTYNETSDLVLDGQTLIGEDAQSTIINITDYNIQLLNRTAEYTNAGDPDVTTGSPNVGGAGTSYNTVSGSNPISLLGDAISKVSSITDATNLVLTAPWEGPDVDLLGADIISSIQMQSNANVGSILANFTINHSPTAGHTCITVTGFQCHLENLQIIGNSNSTSGIQMSTTSSSIALMCTINNCSISGCVDSIVLEHSYFCSIQNSHFASPSDNSIAFQSSCFNSIVNCHSHSTGNYSFHLDVNSHSNNISNSTFHYFTNNGIYILGNYNNIIHCNFTYSDTGASSGGILINGGSLNKISFCRFNECRSGVYITGGGSSTHIISCTFTSFTLFGIYSSPSSGLVIIEHNTFINTAPYTGAEWAIYIDSSSVNGRTSISGNIIKDCYQGIRILANNDYCIASNNILTNIEVQAIVVYSPSCIISNNAIEDLNQDAAISIISSANSCIVTNNICKTGALTDGIFISTDNNIISNNHCEDFTLAGVGGIHLSAAAQNNLCTNNICLNNDIDIFDEGNNNYIEHNITS